MHQETVSDIASAWEFSASLGSVPILIHYWQ
jgi:hypothetical protein